MSGGCFAEEYHWKDGVGPKENRKEIEYMTSDAKSPMANLAQTVNVLQSIILTEGDALDYNDFTKPEEVSFAL